MQTRAASTGISINQNKIHTNQQHLHSQYKSANIMTNKRKNHTKSTQDCRNSKQNQHRPT